MTKDQLIDLLGRLELTRDGDVFRPPPGFGVVVYLGVDREPLVIDHITKLEVAGPHIILTAQRKDRIEKFGAPVETVRTVHVFTDRKSS
jgi:hypothetical protein